MADGDHSEPVEDRSELLAAIARMERDPLWRAPVGDDYRRRQEAIVEAMDGE